MGNSSSTSNKSAKKEFENFYELIDYIATNYILTMDFKSLTKLSEREYCDKLVVLTSDIINKNFTDLEVTYLMDRVENGVQTSRQPEQARAPSAQGKRTRLLSVQQVVRHGALSNLLVGLVLIGALAVLSNCALHQHLLAMTLLRVQLRLQANQLQERRESASQRVSHRHEPSRALADYYSTQPRGHAPCEPWQTPASARARPSCACARSGPCGSHSCAPGQFSAHSSPSSSGTRSRRSARRASALYRRVRFAARTQAVARGSGGRAVATRYSPKRPPPSVLRSRACSHAPLAVQVDVIPLRHRGNWWPLPLRCGCARVLGHSAGPRLQLPTPARSGRLQGGGKRALFECSRVRRVRANSRSRVDYCESLALAGLFGRPASPSRGPSCPSLSDSSSSFASTAAAGGAAACALPSSCA